MATPDSPIRKTAKLFRNGRSQAVRLPKEFRFEGTEVEIRRDSQSGAVVISPLPPAAITDWKQYFAWLATLPAEEVPALERSVQMPVVRDFMQ